MFCYFPSRLEYLQYLILYGIEMTKMQTKDKLHPQYVTDNAGHQTAVILPLGEYAELLEDLDDLAAAAERVDEPTVPHSQVVAELRKDGYLSD